MLLRCTWGLVVVQLALWLLLRSTEAHAQIFVQPQRAGQSQVRHFDFDWQHIDINPLSEGPDAPSERAPGPGMGQAVDAVAGGGVTELPEAPPPTDLAARYGAAANKSGARLYFYARERQVAERAAGYISRAYRYLARQFNYAPEQRFPYVLYNTYTEFLQTNLFPLREGVLGVTSPWDLTLTLPYFGDHKRFHEVGTHELAHQFTIQKVNTVMKEAGRTASATEVLPLWFAEGVAEYYAQRGLDPETEMRARDLVVNPDVRQGYALLDFFTDNPRSVLWTYKLGQARVAFLEQTYGRGTIQTIIERTPDLVANSSFGGQAMTFAHLIERVTGESKRTVAARFEAWLKKRAYADYLASRQGPPDVEPLSELDGPVTAFDASPNGQLLMYRTLELNTGRTELYLFDYRFPNDTRHVASDGVPGIESLHPISRRNFAIHDDAFVFIAESGGNDVVYHQALTHATNSVEDSAQGSPDVDVELDFGARQALDLGAHDLVSADSPAFSPDGTRVAFIAVNRSGVKDLYIATIPTKDRPEWSLRRITHDLWAERELAWGAGRIVFTSDATGHGSYNLFEVRPDEAGSVRRLTTQDQDHFDPEVLADGRVLFAAYDHARANIYELRGDGAIVRRTEIDTGFFEPASAPGDGLWTLWYHSGRNRIARLRTNQMLNSPNRPAAEVAAPREIPHRRLDGSKPYSAMRFDNWRLGNLFGVLGVGGGGIVGQLYATASDRLRDHNLLLDVNIYGEPELTDGTLLYFNQKHRLPFGGGGFHHLLWRVDNTFEDQDVARFTSLERFFGALGLVRYPINRFFFIEGQIALGGVSYTLFPGTEDFLDDQPSDTSDGTLLEDWRQRNAGVRAQTEATFRLGFDTVRYDARTGPLQGGSLLLETSGTAQPFNDTVFGETRFDGAYYLPIYGSANVFFRSGLGTSYGGRLARQFYLSSFDTLRGVNFGDLDFLLGRHFFYSTAELQFPLSALVRVLFFPAIEGVVGVDFGAVGDELDTIWEKRVFDVALGVNFLLGPLVFRVHFAKPIDTGANPRAAGIDRGLPNGGDWVTNLSLNWLYF